MEGFTTCPACENGKVQGKQVGEFVLNKIQTRRKEIDKNKL